MDALLSDSQELKAQKIKSLYTALYSKTPQNLYTQEWNEHLLCTLFESFVGWTIAYSTSTRHPTWCEALRLQWWRKQWWFHMYLQLKESTLHQEQLSSHYCLLLLSLHFADLSSAQRWQREQGKGSGMSLLVITQAAGLERDIISELRH